MINHAWDFREDSASEDEIFRHLSACNLDFVPPLDRKVDLRNYARKLADRAATFEAWKEDVLVGLVAAYPPASDHPKRVFVSNVSVLNEFASRGLAGELVRRCLEKACALGADFAELEVSEEHTRALGFYLHLGFEKTKSKGGLVMMKMSLHPKKHEEEA